MRGSVLFLATPATKATKWRCRRTAMEVRMQGVPPETEVRNVLTGDGDTAASPVEVR
jgi:hypothetical protein